MASLVADYGDSSGNSDDEDDIQTQRTPTVTTDEAGEKSSVNFFSGDGTGGSSDDSDAEDPPDDTSATENSDEAHLTPKLPNPFLQAPAASSLPVPLLSTGERRVSLESSGGALSSVFVNPFEQAEQAKLGILEKHVRLTEAAPKKPASKQVCFKFKKGLCQLGAKCRFFHDRSNLALGSLADRSGVTETEQDSNRGERSFQFSGHGERLVGTVGGEGQVYHPAAQFSGGQPADLRGFDEDDYMNNAKRRKRHGMTDQLVPPKKAMMDLDEHRKKERPWTTKK